MSFLQDTLPYLAALAVLLWLTWILWQYYYQIQRDSTLSCPLPPGSMGIPVIGQSFQYLFKYKQLIDDNIQKHGPIFKLHVLGYPTIAVAGVNNVKTLLQGDHTLIRNQWPDTLTELLGPGALSIMHEPEHKAEKKVILSAFTHRNLSSYMPRLQTIIQTFLDKWVQNGHILAHPEGKALSFAVTCELIVGFRDKTEKELAFVLNTFCDVSDGLFALPINLPGSQFYRSIKAKELLKTKIIQYINDVKSSGTYELPTVLFRIMDFMDKNEADTMNNDYLANSIIEMMQAGFGTNGSAVFSLIMLLAQNPHVVENLRAEIREFGVDGDAKLTFDSIQKMPYVNAVMLEVLVQKSPFPFGFRQALQTFEHAGYQFPKGWKLMYLIRESHELYIDSEFNPDRWLGEHARKQTVDHPGARHDMSAADRKISAPSSKDVLHFGYGSRVCAGKEFVKIFLRTFIIRYVETCNAFMESTDPVKVKYLPFYVPVDGLPVKIVPQKDRTI